ncbi:MAG: metallophosphoesterase [Myxococcales bacterium]|nr:metallophosphoesterase [Myxococcales bacterium]
MRTYVSRTLIVGDVHGCLAELDALLVELEPRAGDRFVFVGDIVDRGPDSVGVVRRVRELCARYPGRDLRIPARVPAGLVDAFVGACGFSIGAIAQLELALDLCGVRRG